jgi:hypothetical protein
MLNTVTIVRVFKLKTSAMCINNLVLNTTACFMFWNIACKYIRVTTKLKNIRIIELNGVQISNQN